MLLPRALGPWARWAMGTLVIPLAIAVLAFYLGVYSKIVSEQWAGQTSCQRPKSMHLLTIRLPAPQRGVTRVLVCY